MQRLAKAAMQRLKADGSIVGDAIEVLYNPTEFTLTKANQFAEIPIPGLASPMLQFIRGQAETLALDLFFDTTDLGGTGAKAKPVTEKTDQFYSLLKIQSETHAPPIVQFSWAAEGFPGSHSHKESEGQIRNSFIGVVENIRQRFTMFSSLGLPLRATLSLQLKEYKTLAQQIAELNLQSPDRTKTHIVQDGETITRIAEVAQENGAGWRRIALWNGIENPFQIEPGRMLQIPPISAKVIEQ